MSLLVCSALQHAPHCQTPKGMCAAGNSVTLPPLGRCLQAASSRQAASRSHAGPCGGQAAHGCAGGVLGAVAEAARVQDLRPSCSSTQNSQQGLQPCSAALTVDQTICRRATVQQQRVPVLSSPHPEVCAEHSSF